MATEFRQEHHDTLTAYTPSKSDDCLAGILPNLLSELYILERLGNKYQLGEGHPRTRRDTEQVIQLASEYTRQTEGSEQHPITAFVVRWAGDFPDRPSVAWLGRGPKYAMQARLEEAIADFSAVIEMPDAPAELKAEAEEFLRGLFDALDNS